jgi:hypothetical protein
MLIQNYGLFWRLDQVYWGKQKDAGKLLGRRATRAKSNPVDFRGQRGVYVLYDDSFKIVYLGQAGGRNNARLFGRLKVHKRDHLAQRWSRFSWFGVCPVVSDKIDEKYNPANPSIIDVLDHIEGILLAAAEPPLNLQRGRFGRGVERFLQVPLDRQQDWEDEEEVSSDEVEEGDDVEAGS